MNLQRLFRLSLLLTVVAMVTTGCSTMAPQTFENASPTFEPDKFFEGPVRSWGVMERRSGDPSSRFRTEVEGVRGADGDLALKQLFFFEDGRTQHREWRIHRVDPHRYEATANDVAGTAVGEAYGNAFRWDYTLQSKPGNPLFNVQMHHWMYLQADGTMVNRVQVTKFGVKLQQITEYFRKGTEPVAAIGEKR